MLHALEVKGLCKSYSGFAVKNINFNIPLGAIMGFVGPNGAGKTTTIKMILNLLPADAGEICIFEHDATQEEARADVGVISDISLYPEEWSGNDVERVAALFYRHWDRKRFNKILQKFKIDKKKKVGQLSRGMNVKLMFAAALSHNARLLILDEPTSVVDIEDRDEICAMLSDYVKCGTKSVLFSTHITSDLDKIADYITCIREGNILFSGTKQQIVGNAATLEEAILSMGREK